MSSLQNKIDFVALVSVTHANSNGDPLNGNRPRTDLNGFGEISDVCIKRKIRNRMQDLGEPIFVQSEDRCSDGCGSLSERASAAMKGIKDREEYARHACETSLDVRSLPSGMPRASPAVCAAPSLSIRRPACPPWRSSPSRSPRA